MSRTTCQEKGTVSEDGPDALIALQRADFVQSRMKSARSSSRLWKTLWKMLGFASGRCCWRVMHCSSFGWIWR